MSRAGRLLRTALTGLVLAGCGNSAEVPVPDYLTGTAVAQMAERELERAHPGMAPGTFTCPDLDWELGASVRCVQVAELSGGRQVSIEGTISVTAVEDGGRLHVQLDDTVASFGITGDHLAADLATQARSRLGGAATAVRCPLLSGPVGTTVRCRLVHDDRERVVVARVTARDQARNATSYVFDWDPPDPG